MIYNIAVFGSCASRDNFYSGINPDYKKYFNCSISSQRGSIISLMQEPVSFKNQDIQILPENRVNKAGTQFINQDLTKNFLAEVKKFKPDYILIDNYFEVIFGIIKYENCFITNNYWDLPKTKFHTEIKPYTKINMYNDPNTYLKLYKENMGLFLDHIQKESQNSQIILNPVRLGYKILKNDNKIEVNKNLLSIADAIYKKEFQNFDSYSEDELITSDFGLIPKNWCYKTLDEISDVAIGKTPPRKETWWFSEQEGVKWVSIKDLGNSGTYIFETSEYLTKEAIEKFNVKLIPKDTVILSFKLTVGRIGITTEEMVTNEAIAHFKLTENSVITKEYLYLYLKNFNYEELGSTSSIAKAINSKIVKKIPILIPNNKINEFKDLFENIFDKIKSNQLEINKLTKLRNTLLPKLMSGEIDVSKINCDLKIIIRKIFIYFFI